MISVVRVPGINYTISRFEVKLQELLYRVDWLNPWILHYASLLHLLITSKWQLWWVLVFKYTLLNKLVVHVFITRFILIWQHWWMFSMPLRPWMKVGRELYGLTPLGNLQPLRTGPYTAVAVWYRFYGKLFDIARTKIGYPLQFLTSLARELVWSYKAFPHYHVMIERPISKLISWGVSKVL